MADVVQRARTFTEDSVRPGSAWRAEALSLIIELADEVEKLANVIIDGAVAGYKREIETETILDQHEFIHNTSRCSCGLRNNMDGDVLDLHRISLIGEAVRNALAIPGIAVVELPEPDGMEGDDPYWGDAWWIRYLRGDGIEFEGHSIGLNDVRALAAALLAAADRAERDQ